MKLILVALIAVLGFAPVVEGGFDDDGFFDDDDDMITIGAPHKWDDDFYYDDHFYDYHGDDDHDDDLAGWYWWHGDGGYWYWWEPSDSSSSSDSSDSHDFHSSDSSSEDFDFHCEESVAEMACDGGYSTLCKAIKEAGLYHLLNDKHEHFTAFFPTNDAFEQLLDALNYDDVRDIPHHKLEDIVKMHVKKDEMYWKYNLRRRCSDLMRMASGDDTRTICSSDNIYQKGAGNTDDDKPKIIKFDKEACNGVVHVVDEVILPGYLYPKPKCESISDYVCDDHDFEILCSALRYTELDDDLDDDTWTLFAPTDASFKEMLNRLKLDSVKDFGKEKLTDVLLYHVVANDELKFNDLHCGDDLTMASGEDSETVCNDSNGHKFQKGSCNFRVNHNVPRIIQKDVKTCNGYIQVVEDVLLPESFCDHFSHRD